MRRREFITFFGGIATWPLAARAQPSDRIMRIGMLMGLAEDDPETTARLAAFRLGLSKGGWIDGRNVHIDYRYAPSGDRADEPAKELIALEPDVILAHSAAVAATLHRETSAIPVVFVNVSDPIGSGFIASLARPGGNFTGVLHYEASITGKWLAMLKEIAPHLVRVAILANPIGPYDYFLRAARAMAQPLAIEIVPSPVSNGSDIEHAIESVARMSNGGLLFPPDVTTIVHRDVVIGLAAQHRLPAIYPFLLFVAAGGLLSYGTDQVDMFRLTANYVDRILRGEKPANLPVQAPTRFETAINPRTAKALDLAIPPGLLLAADEVIE
jgi:putative ABC transport system substrate-binding protein